MTAIGAIVKGQLMNTYFERKAYSEMLRWKDELAPRYALFLPYYMASQL